MAEKVFSIVACHAAPTLVNCAIMPTCNLKNGLRRAVDAFLYELDRMTLEDAITSPSVAASLLRIRASEGKEVAVPIASLLARKKKAGTKRASSPSAPARRSVRRARIPR
jgi:Rrf2 family nitric oxide-sensitive transcriptional repressor